ncbi:MAG: competence/damage-inducible protein A, partial [Bacteroidales bacterium]|nr:competence/damage-inducible protein A [Bacteroidales bacterium]
MTAKIISIGDELLIGQVTNTNATWLAEQLNLIGIKVGEILVISDTGKEIEHAVKSAISTHDLVITTGGLGPTKDDITKQCLAQIFNAKMVVNEMMLANNTAYFKARGYELTEINRKQAEVPDCCEVIENSCGTAAGMWFNTPNGGILISLAGVPYEMKTMMERDLLPRLKALNGGQIIIHKTVMTHGLGESFLSERIASWEDALPSNFKLAYLPQPGILRLRLDASGTEENALNAEVTAQLDELHRLIPELIYGYENESLESVVFRLLKSKKQTLSIAESCTGGYISHRITLLPGSSAIFQGSVVAYDNNVKLNLLNVSLKTIEDFGSVSEQCVKEMAEGVRKLLKTDYAIAVSGVAGPDGGTDEKPVGTTWIAVATPQKTIVRKFSYGDNRERNIHRTCLSALNLLRL